LSPFSAKTEKIFIERFSNITKAVIYGMFIVGIIQGIVTGIGLYIFKAPQPLLLTMFATLFGIIPIVGPGLVWIPVSIGMIISGKVANGIGLALYGFLIINWIDPLIRPYFVKKRAGMPHIIALVGMLGGGYLFGIIGFVLGPLILGYLSLFLDFYRTKTLHELFG
jgi:predicted PurR-regulated permease PerM